jgi:hypothetical protein
MKKSEQFEDLIPKPNTIWFKLWKAKQEIEAVKKNAKNPHFKNNYADINALIEAVEPVLLKYNLLLMQPIENGCVVTRIVDCESGDSVESTMRLPEIQDPQRVGSAVTYYRRYTLQSLMTLQAEDTDAQDVSDYIKKQKPKFPQDRFENGLTKVGNGELTADAFKKALEGFELTELQTAAIKLI